MENGHILDVVDDDLGEKFIWQQQHQALRGHQGDGEEIAQRRGMKLVATRVEVGKED
jgi:hypothetical protein